MGKIKKGKGSKNNYCSTLVFNRNFKQGKKTRGSNVDAKNVYTRYVIYELLLLLFLFYL